MIGVAGGIDSSRICITGARASCEFDLAPVTSFAADVDGNQMRTSGRGTRLQLFERCLCQGWSASWLGLIQFESRNFG